MSKSYYRVMLGAKSVYAELCYQNNFIGSDYGIKQNLSSDLYEDWREFNAKYRDIWLALHPDKSKVASGLACGMLWTVSKGMLIGDIILCPTGNGNYYVGEVSSDYYYVQDEVLPHRRNVKWYSIQIERASMSDALRNSTGSVGTVSNVTQYAVEIDKLIGNVNQPTITTTDNTVEDPTVFALEKHLEDFLVKNWKYTELGKNYDIYEEESGLVGQQYPSDTGALDILAISKDKSTLLVVELKKGRVSDNVVGQIQRYMGFVKEELAEPGQTVKGVIIGLEDDIRIKRALAVTQNIEFYKYQVSFKLYK
ncbi:endonuclease NucS domain-containing protein [Empedobacter brevis]|uniref:endonuclease NucS domain-containing protein n=1 Tax=Empedobacter brevis TaxID=247 RepID=UPI0028B149E2|nr:endonuclease NucS domain-containing protein [Empedobacter brevis]